MARSNSVEQGDVRQVPGILASAATGAAGFIGSLGGDVDRIFGHAGIAPDMTGSPTLRLRLPDFCRLFEEAARQTRYGNLGLKFGNQFQPRDLGFWGYAAVSSPTLGVALANLVDLLSLHQESTYMSITRGSDGLTRLAYQIEAASIVERRQDAELSLGMFLNVIRESCGSGWAPEEVHFEHPRPVDADEHERAFGAPVYFSQPRNALLFRADILGRPMPARDVRLMDMMRLCLVQLHKGRESETSLLARIRTAVRSQLAQTCPSIESIAVDIQLPVSALNRELAAADLNFKAVVDDVRRELALSYLRQRQLTLSEIALLLGYSELSAFSRAFHRWTGSSPRSYRCVPRARH
jgi:AraC-like DNA-binding protein